MRDSRFLNNHRKFKGNDVDQGHKEVVVTIWGGRFVNRPYEEGGRVLLGASYGAGQARALNWIKFVGAIHESL